MVSDQQSNNNVVERDKMDSFNTQTRDHSLSFCSTGTTITTGGVQLYLYTSSVGLNPPHLVK